MKRQNFKKFLLIMNIKIKIKKILFKRMKFKKVNFKKYQGKYKILILMI